MPRIALVHATPVAIDPVVDAFRRDWPDAEIANLLEDSLAPDLEANGSIDQAMIDRFVTLARYMQDSGADAILFTCSAFGVAIEEAARTLAPLPVLKPNEAMFEDALAQSRRIGLVATFQPSLPSMTREFEEMAQAGGIDASISTACSAEALTALKAGDGDEHDRLIAEAAKGLEDAEVILLAQFSMARALNAVTAATGKPVLTSPASAVAKLRRALS
jgi:Asp/Glu/hydantoin racemase